MFGNKILNKTDLINSIKSRTNDENTKVKYKAYTGKYISDEKDNTHTGNKGHIGNISLSVNDVKNWRQNTGKDFDERFKDNVFDNGDSIILKDDGTFLFRTNDNYDEYTVYLIRPWRGGRSSKKSRKYRRKHYARKTTRRRNR